MSETPSMQDIPMHLRGPLNACARGDLAPNVALMRLMIEAQSTDEIDQVLQTAGDAEPLASLQSLWQRSAGAWQTIKSVLANADHAPSESGSRGPAYWADLFDQLADSAPEAGVALYSLGSPALLDLATASIVDRLHDWGLLKADTTVLDLGCGIGRVCAALAPRAHVVLGIDVSPRMLALARRRCAEHPNVLLAQTSGRDLAALADALFDVVLAVDTFPYLVLAGSGVAEAHLRESRRVLKPGGSLVAFNYAYGVEDGAATETFRQHAVDAGLEPVRLGTRDLAWWDGITYHVRRAD